MSGRSVVIKVAISIIGVIFCVRLFYIQIMNDDYKVAAENNVVQKIIQYPYRGLIYTEDTLLTYNTPVYDLMVVPKEVEINDTIKFCDLLGITKEEFNEKMRKASQYSDILSSIFLERIPNKKFAIIQDRLIRYPGFFVQPRTVRAHNTTSLANVLGYVGEVSASFLKSDTTNYYQQGDYHGIGGIEKSYETALRGKRGVSYKVVNVQGVIKENYRGGEFDTLSIPGQSIKLTIHLGLQQYAEKLMEGKVGSVVAIEPATGKVLLLVSAPSFDPNMLSGNLLKENYPKLLKDDQKPLFNRPIQAKYPPGSMFKTIQGIVALHMNALTAEEKIYTDGTNIGDLAPPGYYDLKKGITYSSNNFFYLVMRRMIQSGVNSSPFLDSRVGLSKWRDHISEFGLGKKLGIDLPNEATGNIPSVDYYDRVYGYQRWKYSNISSLSIGQGEILVTPLQMANLGAILANRGYFVTPHVVDQIDVWPNPNIEKTFLPYDTSLFSLVIDGMEQVVMAGSGRRGYLPGMGLCGKTSTVQNPHGEDHSGFMGFAPKNKPKIAIAAYVENAGQGGRAAVSVASLLIEKYLYGEVSRKWLEDYVLEEYYLDQL